jgi:hypothetical protein
MQLPVVLILELLAGVHIYVDWQGIQVLWLGQDLNLNDCIEYSSAGLITQE